MKRTIATAVVVMAALMLPAAVAQADWYLPYGTAKRVATDNAFELCKASRECYDWGARCQRVTQKRFNCEGWTVDYSEYGDITCSWMEKIGVSYGGYVSARYVGGSMDCY